MTLSSSLSLRAYLFNSLSQSTHSVYSLSACFISSTLSYDILTALTLSRCAQIGCCTLSPPPSPLHGPLLLLHIRHRRCSISTAAPYQLPRLLLLCQLCHYYCELLIFFYLSKCPQNTVAALRLYCLHLNFV